VASLHGIDKQDHQQPDGAGRTTSIGVMAAAAMGRAKHLAVPNQGSTSGQPRRISSREK